MKHIKQQITESIAVKRRMLQDRKLLEQLVGLADAATAVLRKGGRILIAGNGGSAADAQHIAGELVGRFMRERDPWPVLALSTDTSVMTSLGNDYGFREIFARQVRAHGRAGDLFLGISTSGNSPNIVAALRAARRGRLITAGLTGGSGGRMDALCDHLLRAPAQETPRIQEAHILIIHILCGLIEDALTGKS
ncbi:MAG: D-sedoheptulose 7-phosphate isomerase [Kiritimatiellia bacterium]|nr:D-sedoheptulose 7-phosphate isomerase [Lentisphaerota bacterium]